MALMKTATAFLVGAMIAGCASHSHSDDADLARMLHEQDIRVVNKAADDALAVQMYGCGRYGPNGQHIRNGMVDPVDASSGTVTNQSK